MISIENVDKLYKKKQVLHKFSMQVPLKENVILGLLGPNGAGKTTVIKLMTGLLEYSSGSISVSEDENYLSWCKENVVLVPVGERGLRYKNTVRDNVIFFSAMKGIDSKKARALLDEYAAFLHFNTFLDRRIETLSTGEKKKAMLLCGLCTDVQVIIMDEPSNGLDIDTQMEMKALVKELALKYHKTFIISSHDLSFLDGLADKSIFLFNGRNAGEIKGHIGADQMREIYMQKKLEAENFI